MKEFNIAHIMTLASTNSSYAKKVVKKANDQGRYITTYFKKHVPLYQDIHVEYIGDDIYVWSEYRGVTFIMKDIVVRSQKNPDVTKDDVNFLIRLINESDKLYDPQTRKDIEKGMYIDVLNGVYGDIMVILNEENNIKSKAKAKAEARSLVKRRYKLGEIYALPSDKLGDDKYNAYYRVKKTVYTIGDTIVNNVIMKLIYGSREEARSVSPLVCRSLHVKYESDLYTFSMLSPFVKITNAQTLKFIKENEKREDSQTA